MFVGIIVYPAWDGNIYKRKKVVKIDDLFIGAPQVGLEPTTYGLTVRRSNQLSYWGIYFVSKRTFVSQMRCKNMSFFENKKLFQEKRFKKIEQKPSLRSHQSLFQQK